MSSKNGKYKPEVVNKLLDYVRAGNFIKTACECVGVSPETYRKWTKLHPDFARRAKVAEAEAIAHNVSVIETASKSNWQASAWFLERKDYKNWGKKQQIGGIEESPLVIRSLGKEYEDKSREELIKEFNEDLEKYQAITSGQPGYTGQAPEDKKI
jgi:hypothetical protein